MRNQTKERGPSKYTCCKLSKVVKKIQRYYDSALNTFEITPAQFYVLNVLLENNGLKFKSLAEKAHMDGSTLTGILDRMENSGFLERRPDPEDRRSLLVFLTEKAELIGPEIAKKADELEEKIRSQFSDKEFSNFIKVLDKLFEVKI